MGTQGKKMVDEVLFGKVSKTGSQKSKRAETSMTSKALRSELSLDINEILELDSEEPQSEAKYQKNSVQGRKIKCCPILIGGADMSPGCSQMATPRICSSLHCRDCDFSVSSFQHQEWVEPVDYLFLRTNMPNFKRVSEKLRKKFGTIAYACHCVSFSTRIPQFLHDVDLPWFCRGHDLN